MRRVPAYAFAIAMAAGTLAAAPSVSANIFTHILREAGEAGGKAASHSGSHLGAVGKAAGHLKGLSTAPKGALAAHATPEGHWQFVNREGQVFTAGTADEMKRVLPSLSPDIAAGESKLTLYLSEDSVFHNRAALDQLPKDASLHVVTDHGAYAVTRSGTGSAATLKAQIKPNVVADLSDRALFDETLSYLGRSLNKANIRTIAVQPGAAKRLPSAPKLDGASKLPLVDEIDPAHLADAFGSIRGQTALIVGRIENGKIYFTPSNGPEVSHSVDELVSAAGRHDVNLVMLQTDAARQPGGRNWLWQSIEVGGLKDASKAKTFGDFVDALGARRGGFQLSAAREGSSRVKIAAAPANPNAGVISDTSNVLQDAVSHVTGEIVSKAVEMHGRDDSSQREIDGQWIPGIPTYIQIPYLIALVAGLISWGTLRGWWQKVWPVHEVLPDVAYAGQTRRGISPNKILREVTFLVAFLPVAAFPALIWQGAVQVWQSVTAPFRWIYRRFLRREI